MDAIALLGLKREDLFKQPPVCPTDNSLTAHSYSLWDFQGLQGPFMDQGSNSGLCLTGLRPLRILAVFWNPGRL